MAPGIELHFPGVGKVHLVAAAEGGAVIIRAKAPGMLGQMVGGFVTTIDPAAVRLFAGELVCAANLAQGLDELANLRSRQAGEGGAS